jgi:hypothetical protein
MGDGSEGKRSNCFSSSLDKIWTASGPRDKICCSCHSCDECLLTTACSQTVAVGRGTVAVGDLKVGDSVMAAGADGAIVSSRVYFIHDHKEAAQTVQLHHAAGMLEMTPSHMIPVYTEACGDSYCADADMVAAKEIQAGSRVYVQGKDTSVVQVPTLTLHPPPSTLNPCRHNPCRHCQHTPLCHSSSHQEENLDANHTHGNLSRRPQFFPIISTSTAYSPPLSDLRCFIFPRGAHHQICDLAPFPCHCRQPPHTLVRTRTRTRTRKRTQLP